VIAEIVKALFIPGSVSFLIGWLAAGGLLLARGRVARRLGQTSLVLLAITYVALSLPWVSERLAASLSTPRSAAVDTEASPSFAATSPPPLPPPGGRVVHVSSEPMLQAAVRQLTSNTTIVLAPGVYRLTSTLWIHRTITDIAIRGARGNRDDVVIVGQGMRAAAPGAVPHGIWTGGNVRRVTIANLTIRDVAQHALVFNAGTQSPHVYNVRLVDAGQQFIKSNPDEAGAGVNDGTVEYSVIEYTATAKDAYTNGVDVHTGGNWIIRNNEFRNIVSPAGQPLAGPAVLMWHGSRGTLTEGNTFLNCARGIAYGLEEKPGFDHVGGIIRNNLFLRSSEQPGDVAIMVADSPGTEVLNNTIFVSGTYATPIEYRFPGAHGVVLAHNRLDGAILSRDGASGVERDNLTGPRDPASAR